MNIFNKARAQLIRDMKQGKSELHEESLCSVAELIEINKLGLLTDDSQQGRMEVGLVPKDAKVYAEIVQRFAEESSLDPVDVLDPNNLNSKKIEEEYEKTGQGYEYGIKMKEKAYLIGIIPEEKADKLVDCLNQISNIMAWYVSSNWDSNMETAVTFQCISNTGDCGYGANFPLTGVTHLTSDLRPFSQTLYGAQFKARKQKDCLFATVYVVDARFNRPVTSPDGLFKQVIKVLKFLKSQQ
jgi:hypothetical protein